jgi:nitrate reductase delta subunit
VSLFGEAASGGRFTEQRGGAIRAQAVERIKAWTRERFALRDEDTILVNEEATREPGFPPVETHVGFWTSDGTRHRYRVFRRVEEVIESDIPPSWMRDALAGESNFECSCC